MIRFGIIKRAIKSFLVEILGIGGTTQNRFISPKGLYSKPKNEKALVINLSNGSNQDVVMALQKDIELKDGDVYVTDDKSYIHFHFSDGGISLKTKKLTYNLNEFEVNADNININGAATLFTGGSVKHNGIAIDGTHIHSQGGDSAGHGQANTNPPI